MTLHNASRSQPREPEVITAKEFREQKAAKRGNKFGARKTLVDGIKFDSAAEAERYGTLKLLERARQVRAVVCHPEYDLKVNGQMVGRYTADFAYYEGGRKIVDDCKGVVTEAASLRMRLFMSLYPDITLRIVDGNGCAKPFKIRRFSEKRVVQ